ncbi:MAG: isoprenyl transferase [Bacteroidales bacterium]|nr:isoprenyl transferase [Bacteroidales bacterium]
MNILTKLDKKKLPEHIAIIMDGNGRWAKIRGNKRVFGHKNGVKSVREIVEASGELEIKHLTLYAFSTENWKRPKFEVNALMSLFITAVKNETKNLMEKNVKLSAIGNLNTLPNNVRQNLNSIIDKTKSNTGLNLILALSYSSQQEITEMVRKISAKIKNGEAKVQDITEELISNNMQTSGIPNPELLIRTGGEIRISNFLLWQISYTELYFTETLWPDFTKEHFYTAIYDYQKRERRFGKTGEQIKNKTSLN